MSFLCLTHQRTTLFTQPPIHDTTGPNGPLSALNMTMQTFYNNVVLGPTSPTALSTGSNCWVDVRDIAEGEVRAAEREACGGERIVVSGGEYWWQDIGALFPVRYLTCWI